MLFDLLCTMFNQAGIILYTKYFNQYVWEEQLQVLGLPYFYLGKHSFTFIISLNTFLFQAFFFLGIGIGISITVFICEQLFVKYYV